MDKKVETAESSTRVLPDTARFVGAVTTLWFGAHIKDSKTCEQGFDLEPHAAICLLVMACENVTCSIGIEMFISVLGGGLFDKREARVVAEYGLESLQRNGYIWLDAAGKKEFAEHDHGSYGLGHVQWTLTTKAAKRIAPAYCTIKGLPTSEQAQATKDILAANKLGIKDWRKRT